MSISVSIFFLRESVASKRRQTPGGLKVDCQSSGTQLGKGGCRFTAWDIGLPEIKLYCIQYGASSLLSAGFEVPKARFVWFGPVLQKVFTFVSGSKDLTK